MSIVKMKRLRLIGMQDQRPDMLRLLQHLGCVEIDEPGDRSGDPDWAALTRPDTGALNRARDARASVENALKTLKKYGPKQKGGLLTPRPVITEAELFDNGAYQAALADAGHLVELERQISSLYAEQNKLKTQKLALAPWLALDIPLETASTAEVAVQFGTVAAATDLDALEGALKAVTDLYELMRAGEDRELKYLVFLCHRSVEEGCQEILKEYGFSRSALRGWTGTAAENDRQLDGQLAAAAKQLEDTIAEVASYAPKTKALEQALDRADQEIAREEARCRLLDSSTAFFLEGWVPVPDEEKLTQELSKFVCCWETQDPEPEDYPVVPVKLKNNKFTEPLTTITEMYSLPAYNGVDPNGLMAPFYIFFFGFMFADLGYGLILAGACAFINHKAHPKGGFGQLIRLMIMCGISSAVIGLLTGGFFSDFLVRFTGMLGLAQPAIPFLSVPEGSGLPAPLLDVMNEPMTVLVFSLVIGLIQIVVGMAVKFWMLCRDGQVVDAILGYRHLVGHLRGHRPVRPGRGQYRRLSGGAHHRLPDAAGPGPQRQGLRQGDRHHRRGVQRCDGLFWRHSLLLPSDGHDAGRLRYRPGVQHPGRHARRRPASGDRDPHLLHDLHHRPRLQHRPERDRHLCAHVPSAVPGVLQAVLSTRADAPGGP